MSAPATRDPNRKSMRRGGMSITADDLYKQDLLSHTRLIQQKSRSAMVERLQPTTETKGRALFGLKSKLDPFRTQRYEKARRRWSVGSVQADVFESPLQEAKYLLKELAISLEASNDGKRLEVTKKIIGLLNQPNLHEVRVRGEAAQVVNADANLRLWLGSSEKKDDTSFAAPIPNRNTHSLPTEKTSLATFFDGLGPDKTITPANEEVVGAMLKTGVEGWFAPGFDSNELERHTGGNPLVALGLALYDRHGWAGDSLGIPFNTMHSFLQKVQAAYNPVAYHNAKHACDVTHGVHWMITQLDGLKGVAQSSEMIFACVIAAIIHDVGHDGRGNAYHVATWDEKGGAEFSLIYSDQSPLERHHCGLGFRIARDTGLFDSLPLATRKAVRERVVSMVLGTDFAAHGKIMSEFKRMLDHIPQDEAADGGEAKPPVHRVRSAGTPVFSASAETMTEAEKLTVATMIIKVADLSYPTKGFDYAMIWIDRCLDEFMEQGDREKERNLPVSYDRSTLSGWKAKSQIGFFSFMVKPMYEVLDLIAPMTDQLKALDELVTYWKGQVAPPTEGGRI